MSAGVYGGCGAFGDDGEYYAAVGVDEAAPAVIGMALIIVGVLIINLMSRMSVH